MSSHLLRLFNTSVPDCGCKDRTINTPVPNFLYTFFQKNEQPLHNTFIIKLLYLSYFIPNFHRFTLFMVIHINRIDYIYRISTRIPTFFPSRHKKSCKPNICTIPFESSDSFTSPPSPLRILYRTLPSREPSS